MGFSFKGFPVCIFLMWSLSLVTVTQLQESQSDDGLAQYLKETKKIQQLLGH